MIELVSISNVHGDCTSDYEIVYSGKYTIMNLPDELRNRHIRNATCTGGWGNMNYYIETC